MDLQHYVITSIGTRKVILQNIFSLLLLIRKIDILLVISLVG